jgi:hypothetical protein
VLRVEIGFVLVAGPDVEAERCAERDHTARPVAAADRERMGSMTL